MQLSLGYSKKPNLFAEGWRSEQLFNYRSPTAYYLHRFICLTRNEVCVVQERLIGVITTKQRNLKSENLLWNDWLGRKLFWEQRAWHSQKSERVQYRKVCVHNFASNICLLILTPLYLLLLMYVMNVSWNLTMSVNVQTFSHGDWNRYTAHFISWSLTLKNN